MVMLMGVEMDQMVMKWYCYDSDERWNGGCFSWVGVDIPGPEYRSWYKY